MAGKLAFVEVPEQLARVPADYHIISLSPLVEVAMEQAGRPYTRPEDYLDERVLIEEGIANYAKVETLCATLDAIFSVIIPEVAAHSLLPARWNYFWIKKVYDAFWVRAYQLSQVLATEAPQSALYFTRSQPDLSREWISSYESLYAPILGYLLPVLDIPGERRGSGYEREAKPGGPPERRRLLTRRVGVRLLAEGHRVAGMTRRVLSGSVRGRVLCLDYGASIPHIVSELERLGYEIWIWGEGLNVWRRNSFSKHTLETGGQLADGQIASAWKAVEQDPSVREHFFWEGRDFWPVVSPRLKRLVDHGLPEVWRYYSAARSALARVHPNVVLTSVAALAREKAICHAACKAGVPSVVSRHGEMGMRHLDMASYQDVDSVDWALCWGEWEARWTQRYSRRGAKPLVIGAPVAETWVKTAPFRNTIRRELGFSESQKIALYVPTLSGGNNWYASYMPTDNTYFRHCRHVAKVLLEFGDWKVIIKEHPAVLDSPLEAWSRSVNTEGRLCFIRQPGFSELIHLGDMVILDVPSTTLVQALMGSSRIYAVDLPLSPWEPGVVEHLTSAGVVFCTAGDLAGRLRADMADGLLDRPRKYPREAIAPLIFLSPEGGGAARRAAFAVSEIVVSSRNQKTAETRTSFTAHA